MFASNIFILSVIFRDSELYFFSNSLAFLKFVKIREFCDFFTFIKFAFSICRGWAIFRSVCLRGGQMSVGAAALQQMCGGGFDWDAGHTKRRSHALCTAERLD